MRRSCCGRLFRRGSWAWFFVAFAVLTGGEVAHGAEQPNFLFIMIDDLNDWVGLNGEDGHPRAVTPNIDRLGEQGVYFSNAQTAVAVCGPSRFSIMTGVSPTTSGYHLNNATSDAESFQKWTTLPSYLRTQGYETLAAGKVYHFGTKCSVNDAADWDLVKPRFELSDDWRERGHNYGGKSTFFHPFPKNGSPIVERFGELEGYSLCGDSLESSDVPEADMPDSQIADWAVDRLSEERSKPFFMTIGFARPHVPYTAPEAYFDLIGEGPFSIPDVPAGEMDDVPEMGKQMALGFLPGGDHHTVLRMGPNYWSDLVRSYLACIAFVDAQVGRVLTALESSPYKDNTIIVLVSDHGQELGEKESWRKMSLWEESTRVPLIVSRPGDSGGRVCSEAVSLLDLAPTFVELSGNSRIAQHEGESLVPWLIDPSRIRERPAVSFWNGGSYAVRDERWRYIRYADGTEELYDHSVDPREHENLASASAFESVKNSLEKWIPANP